MINFWMRRVLKRWRILFDVETLMVTLEVYVVRC
ncbi:MAG: hypothetical protein PWP06_570 [Candidatus Marinimicrobia bacterium]|jgi:hypothetical protein|nr:hypothetical protein [Candidatus Neomarinimicrobiota bacterium]